MYNENIVGNGRRGVKHQLESREETLRARKGLCCAENRRQKCYWRGMYCVPSCTATWYSPSVGKIPEHFKTE